MKKIIVSVLLGASLLTTQVLAEDTKDFYVGMDLGTTLNSFDVEGGNDIDSDSYNFKLKLGWLIGAGWRLQGYYQYESYDDGVYNQPSSASLNELGLDVIKTFDTGSDWSPYVEGGIGYGMMSVDDYSESSATEFGAKIGGGVIYAINPSFEIMGGLDLQYRGWTDVVNTTGAHAVTGTSTQLYIGGNFLF